MALYMHKLRQNHPYYRDRTSDQIWLSTHSNDTILNSIIKRFYKILLKFIYLVFKK